MFSLTGTNGKLETALFVGFLKQRDLNDRVSSRMLTVQAKKFAPFLDVTLSLNVTLYLSK